MLLQYRLIITLLIGENFQRQSTVFIREQRQLQIVDRAGSQRVGSEVNAVESKAIIKHFNVKYRAK